MGLLDNLVRMMGGHHGGNRYGGGGHGGGHGGYPPNYSAPLPVAPAAGQACPKCGAANIVQARFCHQCGTSMVPATCAGCGAQIPAGAKFCPQCGKQP